MAEAEVVSPSTSSAGHVMYFRAPGDVSAELVALYFEDLTYTPVNCSISECLVKVTFSSEFAFQQAAEKTSHIIGDGCSLTPVAAPIASSAVIDGTNLKENSIAFITLDVGSQVHVTQYCMNQIQKLVDDLKLLVVHVGSGMLLLDGRGELARDAFQLAASRIVQYANNFATLIVAIPDQLAEENLQKFLMAPANEQVSCSSIARYASGWLYKVTCDKSLLPSVQTLLADAIPMPHCCETAVTGHRGAHAINRLDPRSPTEPHEDDTEAGECRAVISADINAMQLFNRHFANAFFEAVRARIGELRHVALPTVACEASGFVLQGTPANLKVAEQLLGDFQSKIVTEKRWLKTDRASHALVLRSVAAAEDATRTTVVVLDEQLESSGAGEFETTSQAGRRLQLQLVQGSLTEQKDDVLVNSVGCSLKLSQGAISSSMLKKAGVSMQNEILTKYATGIPEYSMAVTKGHQLSCKQVFHVALGVYNGQDSETKALALIAKCLKRADKSQMKSIAFPAIGAGILKYPPEKVITILHVAVSRLLARSLQSVKCVVFDSSTYEIFNSTLSRLLEADARNSSALSTKADIVVGRFHLSAVVGVLAAEQSDLIIHATDKYLTLQDVTGVTIEGAMDKALKDELQGHRANGPLHSRYLPFRNRLTTGSQLVLLNISEVSSLEQWASLITSAFLYADQMKYQSVSVFATEENEWDIDKCIPKLLEAIALYEVDKSIIGTLKQVRIVVDGERSRSAVHTHLQKFSELRSKGVISTVVNAIGKWVSQSTTKESDVAKAQSRCVLQIAVTGLDKASISDACSRLVVGIRRECWQWQGKPSNARPQAYSGSLGVQQPRQSRQDMKQHASHPANALKPAGGDPGPRQRHSDVAEQDEERSWQRREDGQPAYVARSEQEHVKLSEATLPAKDSRSSNKGIGNLQGEYLQRPVQRANNEEENQQLRHYEEPRATEEQLQRHLSKSMDLVLPKEKGSSMVDDEAKNLSREHNLSKPFANDSSSADVNRQPIKQPRVNRGNGEKSFEHSASRQPISERFIRAAEAEAQPQLHVARQSEQTGAIELKEYGREEAKRESYGDHTNTGYVQGGETFKSFIDPSEKGHPCVLEGEEPAESSSLQSASGIRKPRESNCTELSPSADDQGAIVKESPVGLYREGNGMCAGRGEEQQAHPQYGSQPRHQPKDHLASSHDQVQHRELRLLSDSGQRSSQSKLPNEELQTPQGQSGRPSPTDLHLEKPRLPPEAVTELPNMMSRPRPSELAGLSDDYNGFPLQREHKIVDLVELGKETEQALKAELCEERDLHQPSEHQLQQQLLHMQQRRNQPHESLRRMCDQAGLHNDFRLQDHEQKPVVVVEQSKKPQYAVQAKFDESRDQPEPNPCQQQPVLNLKQQLSHYPEEQQSRELQQLGVPQMPRELQTLDERMRALHGEQQRQLERAHFSTKPSLLQATMTESPEEMAGMEGNLLQKQALQLHEEQQTQHQHDRRLQSRQYPPSVRQEEEHGLSGDLHRQFAASSDVGDQAALATDLSSDGEKLTHLTKDRASPPRRCRRGKRPVIAVENDGSLSQDPASPRCEAELTVKCRSCEGEIDVTEKALFCPDCGSPLPENSM